MSGFSEEVAIAVTQFLWPSMEPKKRNDSAMAMKVGLVVNFLSGLVDRDSHRDTTVQANIDFHRGA